MNLVTYPTREAWLEARKAGLGSSDVAAALGLSRWKSPFALFQEKLGIVDPPAAEAEWFRWGSLLEPVILEELGRAAGIPILRCENTIAWSEREPRLFISPDSFIETGMDGRRYLAEAKNVNAAKSDEWTDGPPPYYACQLQHGMWCLELSEAWIGALIGGSKFVWHRVERDPKWETDSLPVLLDFLRRLDELDPPPIDGHDATTDALTAMYHEQLGKLTALDAEAMELTDAIETLNVRLKACEHFKSEYLNKIRAAMGDAEVGVLPDGRQWTWKRNKRGVRVLRGPAEE